MPDYFRHEHSGDQEYKQFYKDRWARLHDLIKEEFTPVAPVPEDELKEPLTSLEDWRCYLYRMWHNHVLYWYKDFRYGICNLARWFRIVWNDRNWDQSFLWKIMLFKMKQMQGPLREHAADGPDQAALDRCVDLLQEVINRDHCHCCNLMRGCDVDRARDCAETSRRLLREFSDLFAEFSPGWWD